MKNNKNKKKNSITAGLIYGTLFLLFVIIPTVISIIHFLSIPNVP
jgi:hypothetical protein